MQESDQPETDRKTPTWVSATFKEFLNDTEMLSEVLELTITGITMLRTTPRLVRAVSNFEIVDNSQEDLKAATAARIAAAEHRASLAQREVDSGFNIVHSQAVVALWSALEDFVRTFVARWLMNNPETKSEPHWAELKIRLGDYESLDDEQKSYYLVGIAEQNTGAPLKLGVNRFECLLQKLGLSGPVKEEVRRTLFEMQQVRNVIAHRRGIADSRLTRACPDLGVSPGQPLKVSHAMWQAYAGAASEYCLEVLLRVAEHLGGAPFRDKVEGAAAASDGNIDKTAEDQ